MKHESQLLPSEESDILCPKSPLRVQRSLLRFVYNANAIVVKSTHLVESMCQV